MSNINGIPSTSALGVQGEIRNPLEKLGAVIGLKRKDSVWAKRLETISNDYEFKRQMADAAYASVSSLRAHLGEVEGRRGRLTEPQSGRISADDLRAQLAEADAGVARAKSAYEAATRRNRKATRDMNVALQHLRRAQRLYRETDNFVSAKPKPLPKGVTADGEILRIDSETTSVKGAPRSQDEVLAEAMADIERQAALAVPRVSFGKRVTVNFPLTRVNAEPSNEDVPHAPDPRPWVARFFRDELEADIRAQVAEKYAGVTLTLSEHDKAKRLKDLEAARLNADYHRCAAIWAKHDADPTSPLDFPADADPRAILGIEGAPVKLRDDED